MSDAIDVVAAIIRQSGCVLVTRRPLGSHLGGLWEFPGGKVEAGESAEEALVREISEELGVTVRTGALFHEQRHGYPDRTVHLRFFECEITEGTPEALGVDQIRWAPLDGLDGLEFPEANRGLLQHLKELSR